MRIATRGCTSRRPRGPLAPPTRMAQPGSRFTLARLASVAGRLARRQIAGRRTRGSHRAAADLTRGPLAAAPSGLCGRPGKAAPSRASVQPPPPCQIRRSVSARRAVSADTAVPRIGRCCQARIDSNASSLSMKRQNWRTEAKPPMELVRQHPHALHLTGDCGRYPGTRRPRGGPAQGTTMPTGITGMRLSNDGRPLGGGSHERCRCAAKR